jgi:hypothetical protein
MLSTASNSVMTNGKPSSSRPYGLARSIYWIKPNSANSAAQAIPGSRTGFFPHPIYPSPVRATQPKGRGLMPQRTPPLRTSCHRATGFQRSASVLNEPDPLDQPNNDQRSISANAEGQNHCATQGIRVTILRDAHLAPHYQTHVIIQSGAGRRRGSHAAQGPVARGARKEHPLAQSPLAPQRVSFWTLAHRQSQNPSQQTPHAHLLHMVSCGISASPSASLEPIPTMEEPIRKLMPTYNNSTPEQEWISWIEQQPNAREALKQFAKQYHYFSVN